MKRTSQRTRCTSNVCCCCCCCCCQPLLPLLLLLLLALQAQWSPAVAGRMASGGSGGYSQSRRKMGMTRHEHLDMVT